jgi:hypothetical protein
VDEQVSWLSSLFMTVSCRLYYIYYICCCIVWERRGWWTTTIYYYRTVYVARFLPSFLPLCPPTHFAARDCRVKWTLQRRYFCLLASTIRSSIYVDHRPSVCPSQRLYVCVCVPQRYCFDVSVVFSVRSNRGWKLIVSYITALLFRGAKSRQLCWAHSPSFFHTSSKNNNNNNY